MPNNHDHARSTRPAHVPGPPGAPAQSGAPELAPASERAASVVDRRTGLDRRALRADSKDSGLDRRRGPGRRLSDYTKAAEDGEMTREQFLFLVAIDEFKKANQQAFPSWTDVLEVIRLLGYRKTMPSELNLPRAEDWRELPNTPAGVRPEGWDGREPGRPRTSHAA